MTFRNKIIAACAWTIPIVGLDVAYILSHDVDIFALVMLLFALAPAWMFLDRDIELSMLGTKMKISAADVSKAKEQLTAAVPRALKHAEAEVERFQASASKSAPSQSDGLLRSPKGSVWIPIGRDDFESDSSGLAFDTSTVAADRTIVLVKVDPGLVLVNLRIEIEKRLNVIGAKFQLPRTPLPQTVRSLEKMGVIDVAFGNILRNYIAFGNAASHGAAVDIDAASEIMKSQDIILKTLDHIAEYEAVETV